MKGQDHSSKGDNATDILTDVLDDRLVGLSPARRALFEMEMKKQKAALKSEWTIPRRPNQESSSLSFAQQRLWFLNQLQPENLSYNQPKEFRLLGTLNIEILKQALSAIVARHEVIRTTFHTVGGEAVQVVNPPSEIECPVFDISRFQGDCQKAELERLVGEIGWRPFDLSRDLMLRSALIRLAAIEHVLVLVSHHIASDAWSTDVFLREFAALYEAFAAGKPSPLPELPIQYADFAIWQRHWLQGEVLEKQLSYWKKQLSGVSVLELPTDRARPTVQTYRGTKESLVFSKTLSDQLQALSRKQGVTLFMTLLAGFQTLLYRYSGQDDIAVGSPMTGRTRAETEGLIGFFLNTLVLRTDLSGDPTFRELLARVRKITLGAYEHQDIPFEKLVEELHPERDLSRNPLFQVMFAHQYVPRQGPELPGLAVSAVEIKNETAKFDLSLFTWNETEGLRARLEYSTDLFDASTITRMLGHFETLLQGIVTDPDQPISDLPILTEAEQHQLLVEWNDTQKDYPKDECIHELFEAQVERSPDDVAVIFTDKQLTYQELNREANQLASYLKNLGVGYEALVGIYVERSLEMAVAVLAVLKAGGAYVPLDPLYPKERLAFMLEDSQVKVVLTQKSLVDALPAHSGQVVCLDTAWPTIARDKEDHVARAAIAENLAYVIYTSGSTGRPKAVAMPHGALSNLIAWQVHNLRRQETSRTLQFTSLSFDVSFQEIFTTWCSGGTLVIPSESVRQDVNSLLRFIADKKIDRIFLPFVALQQLAEASRGQNELAESLREIITAGEQLHVTPHIVGLFSQLRDCYVYNQYGPSESHVVSAFTLSDTAEGWPMLPPIGRPIDNTEIYLLDHRHRPVPVGVPGELYIGGAGLARGYLNHPDLTAEKFIPNPFCTDPGARLYATGDLSRYLPDGNIEFLGRIDHQVKIRGYRVELGEIEAVLRQHPAVSTAVVITTRESPAEKRLVAYVVTNKVGAPPSADLRKFLRDRLPDYMMPSFFVMLDEMPLTPSGKVNRRALPAPDQSRPELDETFVAPRTPIEQALAEIWAEILKLEQIGIHDNFFDLGGHSLLAVRLFAEIEKAFNQRPPLSCLFQDGTIEQLAKIIDHKTPLGNQSCLVPIQPHGSKLPFFCVHEFFGDVFCYRNLARHLGQDQPFYALQARGLNGIEEPFDDFRMMAARYIEEMRTVKPNGPYALGGLCIGGIVAFEMAHQLRAKGEAVSLVALLDSGVNLGGGRARWWWNFLRNFPGDFPSWLAGSWQLNRSQWLTLMQMKIRSARAGLVRKLSPAVQRPDQENDAKSIQVWGDLFGFSEQHRKVARAQYRALRSYKPRVYPGRVTLFRARMQPLFSSHRPDKGWSRVAGGGLDIRIVPGNHLGMLQEPHVRVLAEQLKTSLDRALTG